MKITSGFRPITRRRALICGAALITAPSIMTRVAEAQEKVVYVNTWGGAWTAAEEVAFYKPFTEKTGIPVKPVSPVSIAKVKAAVQTKNYDFDITDAEYYQAEVEDLVEPLDFSVINKAALPAGMIRNNGMADVVLGTNLVYRKDKFPNGGPQSWADFWDVKKFPGNRALYNRPVTMVEYALLADGVPKNKLYPLDIDRAFKSLDKIKPHIKVWWTQGNQSESLIRDGEVDMIAMWNARAQLMIDNGEPLHMVWNETHLEGGCVYVLKGTPRAKYAFQYMDFCAQAKPQAEFCNRLNYGSPNPEALKYMSKEAIAKSPTSPEHIEQGYFADLEWLQPRVAALKERFAQWLAS